MEPAEQDYGDEYVEEEVKTIERPIYANLYQSFSIGCNNYR
jgi:hypothetical protein